MASRRGFKGWAASALTLAVIGVALVSVPFTSAGATARLTVQLVPGAVSAGQPALAAVTFANLGTATLPNVDVTLRLPAGLSLVNAGTCKPVGSSTQSVRCLFGDVLRGQTRHAFVQTKLVKNLPQNRKISIAFQLRVGPGFPPAIITSASALVLASNDAAHRGNCVKSPHTLTATFDEQVTRLPTPPAADPALHVPCTPLSVAVDPPPGAGFGTNLASVDLPKLSRPTLVELTFKDETLPNENMIDNLPAGATPSFHNPNPLWRYDPAKPNARYVVPRCKPGPSFPQGWHSCIVKVIANDDDPDHDYDAGTITLLVQGSGFGDPHFIG